LEQKILDDLYSTFDIYLDSYINEEDTEYFGSGLHCSSLDSCLCQVVYRYFNFPRRKNTSAENMQLAIGKVVHKIAQDCLSKSNEFKVIGNEIKLNKFLPNPIRGKLDTLAIHKATGTTGIIDVKSVRPNAFKYGNLVKNSYKIQINTYRYGAERMIKKPIDWLAIWIIDRSGTNKSILSFVEKIQDSKLEEIFAKYIKAVKDYEEKKTMPDMVQQEISVEFDLVKAKKSWECDWCKYERLSCPGYPEILSSKGFIVVGKYTLHDSRFIPHKGFEMIKI